MTFGKSDANLHRGVTDHQMALYYTPITPTETRIGKLDHQLRAQNCCLLTKQVHITSGVKYEEKFVEK